MLAGKAGHMYKILVVEDDDMLKGLVCEYLTKYGYSVFPVADFKNVEKDFEKAKPDLILLDINLPYMDGFHLCRSLRRVSNIPIIIISARSGDMEQVMGIEYGADDYIVKPFNLEVLHAKMRSALRRVYGEYSQGPELQLSARGLTLDETEFKALYGDISAELTKNEFKLLKKLIEKKERITTREELLEELWDDTEFVDDNTLTVNVTRVKNKLCGMGLPDVIKTKRGVGYYLDMDALT